jgi:hypothetical protein
MNKSSGKLGLAALAALVVVGMTGARLRELAPVTSPAPKRPPAKAIVSDAAEPPMTVDVSTAGPAQPVTAVGTTLKFNTTGAWQGSAGLTFKNTAPPMRFTLTLAKVPNYDLESLTITSGSLSLAVGAVSAGGTTKYFDARGRPQDAPEGAAYTVTARRWDGEMDIQVRRSPGAALGKSMTVSWKSALWYGQGLLSG